MRMSLLEPQDGFLPIEDHGLIGDGTTAALVARDGAVVWLCAPRFDSPPVFCRILDARDGGAFTVAPDVVLEAGQRYEDDTGVLVTELRAPTGLVRIVDTLVLRAGADLQEDVAQGRAELLRTVEVVEGHAKLRVTIEPHGGSERVPERDGLRIVCHGRPDLDLHLWCSRPMHDARTLDLEAGDRADFVLSWHGAHRHHPRAPGAMLDATREAWRRWSQQIRYHGPTEAQVRRSAITLKQLHCFESGAFVAAPTSSLPERIGGARNWDYRFAWVRDAALTVHALGHIGLTGEASGFLGWVLDAVERSTFARVLYDVNGHDPPAEREDPELRGYRCSRPVRWGNGAAQQRQHDVYGEILDCAYRWWQRGGHLDNQLWTRLAPLAEAALRDWREPDQGIWEVRSTGARFTYSAALCHVALHRAAQIVEGLALPGDAAALRRGAASIQRAIVDEAWNPELGAIAGQLGGGALDASVLALPLRGVLSFTDPKMIATTAAIQRCLGDGAGGDLIHRYDPDAVPDGVGGPEGAFVLCSFWLAENLAGQGRLDEAMELHASLCARASPLGLFSEEIDPESGAFLGNFPQALSHVGLIASAVRLARAMGSQGA